MTSIIKVDTIQTAAGGTPTASSLGISGTGKIGQVVQTTTNTKSTSNSNSFVDATNLNASITPTSTSSKIYVAVTCAGCRRTGGQNYHTIDIHRQIGGGGYSSLRRIENGLGYSGVSETVSYQCNGFLLDSPSTTSQVDYKIMFKNETGNGEVHINNDGQELSQFTLMEVLA